MLWDTSMGANGSALSLVGSWLVCDYLGPLERVHGSEMPLCATAPHNCVLREHDPGLWMAALVNRHTVWEALCE